MFLSERRGSNQNIKCCRRSFQEENPGFIFIQPFYAKKTQIILQAYFDLEIYNQVCLANFKEDLFWFKFLFQSP